MEYTRQRDSIDPQQLERRAALSREMDEHAEKISPACFSCGDRVLLVSRLATLAVSRGEMTEEEAIAEHDKFIKGCPGEGDNYICLSKRLRT